MLESLFSPIIIGNVKVPDRCALAPMNLGPEMYTESETWPKKTIRYYEERAIGGTGLLITQFVRAYDKLASYPIAGLYDDRSISEHEKLVKRVHRYGTKIFHQIALMGGKDYTRPGEAPSSIYSPAYIFKPRALGTSELEMLVEKFIEAAGRGMAAGYDGVEIHGAHLYLIGQMMSPATNKRTDKYGGSFEARMRFITDIIKGIKARCPGYAMGVKFNAFEQLKDGIDLELGKKIARHLSKLGVDYLHVTSESTTLGIYSDFAPVPTVYQPRNTLVPIAYEIKKACPDKVIIATGSITVPEEADSFIREGKCDMVALGRTLIADPAWANKAKQKKPLIPCIRCMVCYQQLLTGKMLCCSMNPYMLHESEQDISVASKVKKVLVAGAGPAGLRCALTASRRGHEVYLYEKMPYIGGMMYPGSRPEFKKDVARAIDYFNEEIELSNVKVFLNSEVSPGLVNKMNPDVIVVAIGAKPIFPEIAGSDPGRLISAVEILRKIKKFKKCRAVVIGGGETGCETACYMADNGFKVSLVEILPELLAETEDNNLKLSLLNLVNKRDIEIFTSTKASGITNEGLEVILPDGKQFGIEAELVVCAAGQDSDGELVKELSLCAEEFYTIGDCKNTGRIKDAISEGEYVGRWI